MATKSMTDVELRALPAKETTYKVTVGGESGLVISISKAGTKVFRFNFVFAGKHKCLTIGKYPLLSLKEAREATQEAKRLLAKGIDPCAVKKQAKIEARTANFTFSDVATQWIVQASSEWGTNHLCDIEQKLERHIQPHIGHMPIAAVSRADIKACLDILDAQGKYQTLKKVRGIISQTFQFAVASEVAGVEFDPTMMLRSKSLFKTKPVKHRAALTTAQDVSGLMKGIASYTETNMLTGIALRFSALTFCRPTEVRHALWSEIDIDAALWRIPGSKMKNKKPHIVPLAVQTLALLKKLRAITGHCEYLFPSVHSLNEPMSDSTILAALRRMGYPKEQMTAHGFRGMASTILYEQGFNAKHIELQLAHSERDGVAASYNHASYLTQRREMMQWYADRLDALEHGAFD